MDSGRTLDAAYLVLRKVFDTVSVRQIHKSEQKNRGTKVPVGPTPCDQHTTLSSQQITRGIPQGVILVTGLFNILIDDLDNGIDCTTNGCLDRKSNWGGILNALEHRAAVLYSNRLKKLTDEKLTKCEVLRLRWNKPIQQRSLEVNLTQNSIAEIDWMSWLTLK